MIILDLIFVQDWEDEFMDSLFGLGPYLPEWEACDDLNRIAEKLF